MLKKTHKKAMNETSLTALENKIVSLSKKENTKKSGKIPTLIYSLVSMNKQLCF